MDEIRASNVSRGHANHELALSEGSLIKLFYNDTSYFLLWLNFKATSFAECHGAAALGRSSMGILKIHIIIRRTKWLCNGYESQTSKFWLVAYSMAAGRRKERYSEPTCHSLRRSVTIPSTWTYQHTATDLTKSCNDLLTWLYGLAIWGRANHRAYNAYVANPDIPSG